MELWVTLEIIPSGNNGWDLTKSKNIRFKSELRAEYFSIYYTAKNDCLIRYYTMGQWLASYCNGREIWNAY